MINDKDFLSFVNDKSIDLSEQELESVIDTELEKPANTMDIELIEQCLDALDDLNTNKTCITDKKESDKDRVPGRMTHKFKRIFAALVAAALLFVSAISVSAFVFDVDLFNGIIEFYDDYIRIRFNNRDDRANEYELLGSELAKKLAENGITPVLLPEAMLMDGYVIESIEYEKTEVVITANIHYTLRGKEGHIVIDKYAQKEAVPSVEYLYPDAKIRKIDASNLSVYIMEQNGKGTIAYQDYLTVYFIVTPLYYEDAVEFAKTIK